MKKIQDAAFEIDLSSVVNRKLVGLISKDKIDDDIESAVFRLVRRMKTRRDLIVANPTTFIKRLFS